MLISDTQENSRKAPNCKVLHSAIWGLYKNLRLVGRSLNYPKRPSPSTLPVSSGSSSFDSSDETSRLGVSHIYESHILVREYRIDLLVRDGGGHRLPGYQCAFIAERLEQYRQVQQIGRNPVVRKFFTKIMVNEDWPRSRKIGPAFERIVCKVEPVFAALVEDP